MRILLINPPTTHIAKSSTLWDLEIENIGAYPPIGLMYIAAGLRGHDVRILDSVVEKIGQKGIEKVVGEFRPDVVGITATTLTFYDVLETAKTVKRVNPEIHVNVGGPHTYFFPDETMLHKEIDTLIVGEGEYAFRELVEGKMVEGIVYRDGDRIVKTGRGHVEDIDKLPYPAFDLIKLNRYHSSVMGGVTASIMTSRGCPFRCTYCVKLDNRYRMRSAGNIIGEIKGYYEKGMRNFFFFDDLFNINCERVIVVSEEIVKSGMKITWGFRGRVDKVSEEMFKKASESGCGFVSFGVEDYTNEGLKKIKKEITIEQAGEAVRMAKRVGMRTNTDWIIGLPHHRTKDDVMKLVDTSVRVGSDYAEFAILIPYYGTEIYKEGIEKEVLKGGWQDFVREPRAGFMLEVWEENMDRHELSRLYRECFKRFYGRPMYVVRSMVGVRSVGEIKAKIKGGWKLLYG